ncbi:DUF2470 domain-containing protein [Streptomyces sp. NPDC050636]|uniref:DUF2470 domain-containing protein n=1 Tax=Streptomyces sp. NPDC050636 TaxID=3154510 RepID=UPI00343B9AFD
MSPTNACADGSTAAERIRSVLARAESLTVTTNGHRLDLVSLHTVDDKGQLRLRLPDHSPLRPPAAGAPSATPAALVEFTDIAPTVVRERVRARVALSGWLTPTDPGGDADGGVLHRLDIARATLETATDIVAVRLDELALAAADPLAIEEAAMLTHMADDHPDMVALLTRLADPRLLQGAVRVQPFALDRYGITLRCEYTQSHCDFRFVFSTPVRGAAQAGEQIRVLLAAAQSCPRRHTPSRS